MTSILDENLTPESDGGKVLLAPVALPVGVASILIDGLIINPIRLFPPSVEIAYDVAFDEVKSTGPFELIVFPMRLVTFVAVLVVVEVIQVTFPVEFK